MLVVADTAPLNYLILIEAAGVLPALFEKVVIPAAVAEEMSRLLTPHPVRAWIASPPSWVEIENLPDPDEMPVILRSLHAGEREAIALALRLRPTFLLIDERQGTRIALGLGLRPTGTLAVLDMAAARSLLDLATMIRRLQDTNFRYPRQVVERLLADDRRRNEVR